MIDRRTILAAAAGHLAIAGLPLRCGARAERHSAAYLRTNWSKDPFARGSYSYAAKAARARD